MPKPLRLHLKENDLLEAESPKMIAVCLEAATEKKAHDAVLLHVDHLCSYADHILIVSAESDRQVAAVAERITRAMREHGWRPLGTEGVGNGGWALLDYNEVVVHIFRQDLRSFYDLEGLWVDAEREDFPAEVEASDED